MTPEARCLVCGTPVVDHVALRYPLKAWVWHRVHVFVERLTTPLSRIQDPTIDF